VEQFLDEIVQARLIFRHLHRAAAFRDSFGDLGIQPAFDCERLMRVPLVVLTPSTGGHKYDELTQSGRQRAVEAQVVTQHQRA
jgi:hypothetical protein